jgi:uncharacterized protein
MCHARLDTYSWSAAGDQVTETGAAILPKLFDSRACEHVASLYEQPALFRSHVHMARHGFGKGEYRYFAYPFSPWLSELREGLYARLAPIANRWGSDLGDDRHFPATHREYIEQCHAADQRRPTPLLLKYVAGDYNCLHQDLYGALWFPLQVIVLLNEPERDFDGGQLMVVEQRPRAQSKGMVVNLKQGDAAVIAVNYRPRKGTRGYSRVTLRHGVSPLTRGRRHTLGVIFHDAA